MVKLKATRPSAAHQTWEKWSSFAQDESSWEVSLQETLDCCDCLNGVCCKTLVPLYSAMTFSLMFFFNHVFLIEKKAAKCLLKSREQLARISPYFRENCAFIFSVVSRKAPLVCEVTQEAAIKNTVYCLFFSKLCIPSHGAIYFTYTAEVNKCLRKPSLFVHSLL